jgi:uncharacterized phage protein gp47/JayE
VVDWKAILGWKDKTTLEAEVYESYRQSGGKVTNFNAYGVFRRLVGACLQGVADLWNLLLIVIPQGFASTASGTWLDRKCADVGITRFAAVKTQGNLIFGRNSTTGNVRIQPGVMIKTEVLPDGKELRYIATNTESIILPDGNAEISVPVIAEYAGSAYNVGAGKITQLVTYVSGIDYVTNNADWITQEGTDEETDEALRERYQLKWEELSEGGTDAAYISWARSIAGVRDVSVDSDHPRGQGTVDVTIASESGAPTQNLIDQVQAYIDTKKPNVANVLVKGSNQVPVNLNITLQLPADEGDIATTQAEGEARYAALFTKSQTYYDMGIKPFRISESLYRARLTSIGMGISPVVNVVITQPAADVIASAGDLLVAGTINVTVERVA